MNRKNRNRLGIISASLAAAAGATAAISRSQGALAAPPLNHLGGVQRRVSALGHELFVTELGEGDPVVLIHGVYAGASSYEFRRLAPLLAASHRVIAFDFLGCGLSDHPDLAFTASVFVEQIVRIVHATEGAAMTLVGSSYGAAYAIRAAAQLGSRVCAVVALSPSGIESNEHPTALWRNIGNALLRAPGLGQGVYDALASEASIRSYLRRVYSDERMVTPELLAHYASVTHVPGAKRVVAAFVGGALECDLTADLPFLETPILVIRGDGAHLGPDDTDTIATLGNNVSCETFSGCGALPHEERPQATSHEINSFLVRAKARTTTDDSRP